MEDQKQEQSISQKTDSNKLAPAAFRASFSRNFHGVSDADRANYVSALCKVLGIPTPLNPFYFLPVSQTVTVLYAGIEATQLLAESKKLNIEILRKSLDKETNLYTVEIRVTGPSGRFCDNEGIIYLGGVTGKDRANAMMKAITKAQRRSVLSYCGLSITDDDELHGDYHSQTNPIAARAIEIQNETPKEIEAPKNASIDDFTKDARKRLFKFMLAGKSPLFRTVEDANSYLSMCVEKGSFDELSEEDCSKVFESLEPSDGIEQESQEAVL